eukprot:scaffold219516_cov31-Tisochrysis_lutea.AAC.1
MRASGKPSWRARAMNPPVEVPPITSKSSCTRFPEVASSCLSISIVSRPRVPPPSSASTRTPACGGRRGCAPRRSVSPSRTSSQQREPDPSTSWPHSGQQRRAPDEPSIHPRQVPCQ